MQPTATAPQPAAPAGPGQMVGVIGWQRLYYDENDKVQRTAVKVPINQSGQLAGKPFTCPKCKKLAWLPPTTKVAPVCPEHPSRKMLPFHLKPPTIRQRLNDAAESVSWLGSSWAAAERPLRPVWALVAGVGTAVFVDAVDVPALPLIAAVPAVGYSVYRTARWSKVKTAEKRGRLEFEDPTGDKRVRAAIDKTARTVSYTTAGALAAVAAVAGAGLDTHSVTGWVAVAALAAAWLIPAATWWRSLRTAVRPAPQPVTVETGPSDDEVTAREAANTWRVEVALAGTELDPASWRRIKGGWQAVVVANKRGALNVLGGDNMTGTVKRIAAGFDVPRAAIGWIDEYEGSMNRALLLVQPNSPLQEEIRWEPPGVLPVDAAFLHVGMQITGAPLRTRLWTPGWGAPSRWIVGTKGSGKALALDTPIPTPNGWSTMGALRVGDQVFDETGAPCNVVFATEVMHGRTCYEVVFSDGTVIVADAEHLWKTTTQRGRWQQDNIQRHPDSDRAHLRVLLDVDPVTTEQIATTLKARLGPNTEPSTNHAIGVCGPLDYPKRDLPIQPYTLGAWLGDGASRGAMITNPDPEVLNEIRNDGYIVTDHNVPISHGILTARFERGEKRPAGHRSFQRLLADANLILNKHIPEEYLRSSIDQRRALLAGLLDTDGTASAASGMVTLALCHERLAADAFDLIVGLGFKATMRTKRVKGRIEATSICYSISFTAHEPVFRLPRKRDRQRPVSPKSTSRKRYIVDVRPVESVPVRCIQVDSPNHLYLASKACIPTHNTEALRLLLLGMLEAQVTSPTGPRRLVAPFLHDPKRGKDFGAFRRQVAGFSTDPDMLHLIVEAIIREMERRYDSLGSDVWFDDLGRPREGETAFDPSIHGPIISLVIDEFHEPAKDQLLMAKLEPMARKMRAAGIEVVGASHASTIGDSGTQVFRDMLAGGEAWLFRTTSALNAALATGGQLVGDPRALPRAPGSVLFASGDEDTTQSRMAYVPSEPLYNRLYDERNRSRIMPVEWPPETLEAFGPEFVQWMRDCQAREPGQPAPVMRARSAQAQSSSTAQSVRADTKCVDAVLSALAGSPAPLDMNELESMRVVSAGGWSTRTVRDALKKLREAGLVFTSGSGAAARHELTPQARADIEAQLQAKLEESLGEDA